VTTTLTVQPPPIVTDSIEYYNVNITSNEGTETITPIASLTIVPLTTTITLEGGETQVRTLTLPPWPAISGIPTGGQGSGDGKPTTTRTNTRPVTVKTPEPLPPLTQQPFPTYPGSPDPPETQTSTEPTKTWPPEWEIIPVETEVPEEGDEDDDDSEFFYVSCKLWFFSVSQYQDPGSRLVHHMSKALLVYISLLGVLFAPNSFHSPPSISFKQFQGPIHL
jgi:chitinase